MASAYEIFRRAERVELAAAELYRVLADSFPWSAEDRALLKRLEQEEIQHAARVRLLAAQYRNDTHLFEGGIDISSLAQMEREAASLLEEVQSGRWNGDLEGLKRRIAEAEDRCSSSHAHALAQNADPAIRGFFHELAEQDQAHRDMLLEALRPRATASDLE
jgi:rubrerythrin